MQAQASQGAGENLGPSREPRFRGVEQAFNLADSSLMDPLPYRTAEANQEFCPAQAHPSDRRVGQPVGQPGFDRSIGLKP